jgi:ADP-dependent NAD(P)H-hydrate dehydratase / NAD(P)H-hydrate epimerase
MVKLNRKIIKKLYPPRSREAHKYDFGFLLIIGGGEFYTGSPALAGLAAFRSGVDMVQILAPERAANIIAGFSPNLATYPLKGERLTKDNLNTLFTLTEAMKAVSSQKQAVLIGGGLGRSPETKEVVLEYLEKTDFKVVIDADAIHALADLPQEKWSHIGRTRFLFTPHSYEFFILTGKKVEGLSLGEKMEIVRKEAEKRGTILLKGNEDIISDGREVVLNKTGSVYLTVGGTGDSLAGIAAGFLAQGIDPFLAAQGAAFINGSAGEVAGREKGPGVLASDLIEAIPKVIKQ